MRNSQKEWLILENSLEEILPLDASVLEQCRSLTHWHVAFAKKHKSSFTVLLSFIESTDFVSSDIRLSLRDLNFFLEELSTLDARIFLDQLNTLAYWPIFGSIGKRQERVMSLSIEQQQLLILENEKASIEHGSKLVGLVKQSIDRLSSHNQRTAVINRLGLSDGQSRTLEEIGFTLGVTRERVRQIESKILSKFEKHTLWDDIYRDKIIQIFEDCGRVLLVKDLAIFDDWFDGFELDLGGWRTFIKFFSDGQHEVGQYNNVLFLMPKDSFSNVLKSIKFLELQFRSGYNKEDVIANYCTHRNCNYSDSNYEIDSLLRLAKRPKLNMSAFVSEFIKIHPTPFALEDFLSHAISEGLDIPKSKHRSVENSFNYLGCTPVSRSPTYYASLNQIGYEPLEVRRFCDRFYEYWLSKFKEDRIFHAQEVRSWSNKNKEINEFDSDWYASALLTFDPESRFKVNKLKIGLSEIYESKKMPNLEDLVADILSKAGVPLSIREIKDSINPIYGIGPHFQLHENRHYTQVSRSKWKYINRSQ